MTDEEIHLIKISEVFIANPRPRNPVKFQALVESIRTVGLKKPITVCPRENFNPDFRYELICGQGRMQACQVLGKAEIPAIFKDATREQQYLMSLVENIARRPPSHRALLFEVRCLMDRGYKDGALRLDILTRRQEGEVRCIVATDDEGYTYNKRVNHLSNIGEHYMILKALSKRCQ